MIALLRAQSFILDKTDGIHSATAVAVHVHAAGIEVEVPRFLRTIGRGRPIVAEANAAPIILNSIAIAATRSGQGHSIAVITCYLISATCPLPLTLCF